ncbi:hypothetical protein CQ06_15715 [Ralstonia solanacearum]|nr:hypothetical protein CQ06_15715 [Ralstonia solanacearum]
MIAGDAHADQRLAAGEVVAAADQRLHAGAAGHGLHARPDRAGRDQQVDLRAHHVVAVGDVDGAAADYAARVPCAVEHEYEAGIAGLPAIGVRRAGRDGECCADSHAEQQRGPRNAVHEALTHGDLPVEPSVWARIGSLPPGWRLCRWAGRMRGMLARAGRSMLRA